MFLEQLAEASQGGPKGPCPPISGICALMLLLMAEMQPKRQVAIVVTPPHLLQTPARPSGFQGRVPHLSPFVFLFSPFSSQTLKTRALKNNCIEEKIRK